MGSFFSNENSLIIAGIIIALVIAVPLIFNEVAEQKRLLTPLDVESLSFYNGDIQKIIYEIASGNVTREYSKLAKPIMTQKGQYRAAFLKDVDRERGRLISDCGFESNFKQAFKSFVNDNYPEALTRDLESIIKSFVRYKEKELEHKHEEFLSSKDFISPNEFFRLKAKQKGDVVGVYIIYNSTKDMYYVGQATRLFFRVSQHFTGHGNGDVYADLKYGDEMFVKIIRLSESGYDDLNLLEKDLIRRYNARSYGYNKTKGNSV